MNAERKSGWLAVVCIALVAAFAVVSGGAFAASAGDSYIGEAEAKAIAFRHAGVAEEDVRYVRTSMDRDRRRVVYEVEFFSGRAEYDYEIDAVTGRILEVDVEMD